MHTNIVHVRERVSETAPPALPPHASLIEKTLALYATDVPEERVHRTLLLCASIHSRTRSPRMGRVTAPPPSTTSWNAESLKLEPKAFSASRRNARISSCP